MSGKARKLIIIYISAAIVTLTLLSAVLYSRLTDYRRAALYSSREAFEETVQSVGALSRALGKSIYAVDGGMCAKICAEASTRAFAAEAAISALPFETVQLEQTAAFLNTVGDYTLTLSASAADGGFTQEQLEALTELSGKAADFAKMLEELKTGLNGGETVMDSMEIKVANVEAQQGSMLSASLLEYEAGLTPMSISYDGMYGFEKSAEPGQLCDEEKLSLAAKAAGVAERELIKQYDYEGEQGLCCFSAGDRVIIVSSRGLESMASSRLIDAQTIDEEQAKAAAEKFLKDMGYEGLTLTAVSSGSGVFRMQYCPTASDAVWLDNFISIAIAADEGSVYMFDASQFTGTDEEVEWSVTLEEAEKKLPESVTRESDRKVIVRSEGNRAVPAFEFTCRSQSGDTVRIYVDGQTGQQIIIDAIAF